DSVILTTSSLELWMLSEASRLLLKLKSTDEYCYILFSAFNKFAEEPKVLKVLPPHLPLQGRTFKLLRYPKEQSNDVLLKPFATT
ncbi:MAG: hypothetical protein PUD95_02225, partial [Succinatimonas sp.]|nr:hypothetical protein [Succinatimonas sp.]